MLDRLAGISTRFPIAVLLVTAAFVAAAGFLGGDVAGRLSSGGFNDPASESVRASTLLEESFGAGEPNLVLLVTAKGGSVDDPAVAQAGLALTEDLAAEEDVSSAASYWTLGSAPPLRSVGGDRALVLARLEGSQDHVLDRAEELAPHYAIDDDLVSVVVTGPAQVFAQMNEVIEADLVRAESLAIPITLVLMVLIFGSVVAALLPLAVGILAILGTFLVLRVLTGFTEVSIYALNLTTVMGLGLAIDYALFVVARFREELRGGYSSGAAVVRTVRTAGRTVVFSAATVAVSLAALVVFPMAFLRSFAYAGIAVVAIALAGAVVVLPALLALIGPRVDSLRILRRDPKPVGEGTWHRIAMAVMRRPLPIATAVVAVLVVLGLPFLRVEFGLPDDRALPESVSSRQAFDLIRQEFASFEASGLSVVLAGTGNPARRSGEIDAYATRLSDVEGVARVDALTGSYAGGAQVFPPTPLSARFAAEDGTWLSVIPSVEPLSLEGERLVHEVRDVEAPGEALVGGSSAELVDSKESMFARVPLALGIIAVITFVVLFLMFGSLLVPAKAVVLNVLSLTATFGAMVWIFQEGHLSGLFGFTPTGTIAATMPVLMFCVAFGLSMDYEVFLLSRIKEEYDRSGDNLRSVAGGLERTGRIVTSAAVLIAVVFAGMAVSRVSVLQMFGVGLTLAVLADAFLIRATLVPAFMRLAGSANWWAPRSLRRVHDRFGFREGEDEPVEVAAMGAGTGR